MSFIAKHIPNQEERLVYIARLHWIYLVRGVVWLFLLTVGGIILNFGFWYGLYMLSVKTGYPVVFPDHFEIKEFALFYLMFATGMMVFIVHLFKILGTEIALTSRRIIYKTGLFFVSVEELDLSEIKEERVHHGFLGNLLGFGEVHLDSRFVGDLTLPCVKNPYKLLKYVHKVRSDQHPEPH